MGEEPPAPEAGRVWSCHHTNKPSVNPPVSLCHGPAPPVHPHSLLLQSQATPKHQDGTSFPCGIVLETSYPLHQRLCGTLGIIVTETNTTSACSCPLSCSPSLRPLWCSCRRSPSGRRDSAHVQGRVVRWQRLKEMGPLTCRDFKPSLGVMSFAVAWISEGNPGPGGGLDSVPGGDIGWEGEGHPSA